MFWDMNYKSTNKTYRYSISIHFLVEYWISTYIVISNTNSTWILNAKIFGTLCIYNLSSTKTPPDKGKDTWIEWEMNAKCQQWYPIVYLYIICGIRSDLLQKHNWRKNWISLLIQCFGKNTNFRISIKRKLMMHSCKRNSAKSI